MSTQTPAALRRGPPATTTPDRVCTEHERDHVEGQGRAGLGSDFLQTRCTASVPGGGETLGRILYAGRLDSD
jgi:hypothetical protein